MVRRRLLLLRCRPASAARSLAQPHAGDAAARQAASTTFSRSRRRGPRGNCASTRAIFRGVVGAATLSRGPPARPGRPRRCMPAQVEHEGLRLLRIVDAGATADATRASRLDVPTTELREGRGLLERPWRAADQVLVGVGARLRRARPRRGRPSASRPSAARCCVSSATSCCWRSAARASGRCAIGCARRGDRARTISPAA